MASRRLKRNREMIEMLHKKSTKCYPGLFTNLQHGQNAGNRREEETTAGRLAREAVLAKWEALSGRRRTENTTIELKRKRREVATSTDRNRCSEHLAAHLGARRLELSIIMCLTHSHKQNTHTHTQHMYYCILLFFNLYLSTRLRALCNLKSWEKYECERP